MHETSNAQVRSLIAEVDVSRFPVMVLDASDTGQRRMDAQLRELTRLYREYPTHYATVIDATAGAPMNAKNRQKLGEFTRQHGEHARRYCRGIALVFQSVLMRGVMTAVLWMRPNADIPYKVFGSITEAIAWAQTRVSEVQSVPKPSPASIPGGRALFEPGELEALEAELSQLRAESLAREDLHMVGLISLHEAHVQAGDGAGFRACALRHFGALVRLSSDATPVLAALLERLQGGDDRGNGRLAL